MRFNRTKPKYQGNVIDVHSHILPDIDDGSSSFDQSINMLKIAISEGITTIVATPHLVFDGTEKKLIAQARDKYKKLDELDSQYSLPIRIVLGYELLLSSSMLHSDVIGSLVISGTDIILVEPHLVDPPDVLDELLYELDHYKLRMILAHPERSIWLQRNRSYLFELSKRGILMQVNADSVVGARGKEVLRFVHKMADQGIIHFIGSDAHNDNSRGPYVKKALAALEEWIGEKQVKAIAYQNAETIFNIAQH